MYNLSYNKHSMVNQKPILCSNWFFSLQFGYVSFKSHEIVHKSLCISCHFPSFLVIDILMFKNHFIGNNSRKWNGYETSI